MIPSAFKIAAVASLVLFLATVGLWVRSRWRADVFAVGRDSSIWAFQGSLMWWKYEPPAGDWSGARELFHAIMAVDYAKYVRSMVEAESQWDTKWDRLGFHVWVGKTIEYAGSGYGIRALTTAPSRVVIVPAWLIAGIWLVLPVAWIGRQFRIHWRRAHHICVNCSYDLRASKDRCPECGTPIVGKVMT